MDKAAREKARETCRIVRWGNPNLAYLLLGQALDALEAADSDNARLQARVSELEAALNRSVLAIDDWLNVYASEFCDEARVAEAQTRLGERGTLAYIADVQQQNRAALLPAPPVGDR